jgi:aryl-alcohol dehydrogenase-like predicted oxidoreductase
MLERNVERELIPFCGKYGVGILPYFPLANGFLTGKYRKDSPSPSGSRLESDDKGLFTESNYALLEKLIGFSEERGKTVLDLAFAWLLYNGDISSVIAGATKPEQVISNAAAADWQLTDKEYEKVTQYLP